MILNQLFSLEKFSIIEEKNSKGEIIKKYSKNKFLGKVNFFN